MSIDTVRDAARRLRADIIAVRGRLRDGQPLDVLRDELGPLMADRGDRVGGARGLQSLIWDVSGRQAYERDGGPGAAAAHRILGPCRRLEALLGAAEQIACDLPATDDPDDAAELHGQLDDLFALAQRMAADIDHAAARAERVIAEHPLPLRYRDVQRTRRGGALDFVKDEHRPAVYEIMCLLSDAGMSPARIASWLGGYHWDALVDAPAPPDGVVASNYVRFAADPQRRGQRVGDRDLQRLRRDGAIETGEPGDGRIAVFLDQQRRDWHAGQIGVAMKAWLPDYGYGARVTAVEHRDDGQVTITCAGRDGAIAQTLPADSVIDARDRERIAWADVSELELGRLRYKLVGDGRFEELRAFARRRADRLAEPA